MTGEEKRLFGMRIKQLREEKKISQSELANYFGVTHSCVANWENGLRAPEINIWGKMASYFDVSVDFLCGRSNQKKYVKLKKDVDRENFIDVSLLDDMGKKLIKTYYDFLLLQDNSKKKG